MSAPIVRVEVRRLDQPDLEAFYKEIFGWDRDESLSMDAYSVTDLGAGSLTAATGPVPEWSARSCTFYIQVDEIDQTLERIESAGRQRRGARTAADRLTFVS
ncbi:MAG: hypothetical protein OSB03_06595 [Vicinamibacterales bacterium]|nr:hypothetical protein [Vicinamibacterales bacterium]